jgi:hypothetical protein
VRGQRRGTPVRPRPQRPPGRRIPPNWRSQPSPKRGRRRGASHFHGPQKSWSRRRRVIGKAEGSRTGQSSLCRHHADRRRR